MEQLHTVNEEGQGLKAIGPFQINRIVLDGYEVPLLTGCNRDGMWHFSFDNGLGVSVPELYGETVVYFVANVMARTAGYSCFGQNSKPLNHFKRRLLALGAVSDIDSMEVQGEEQ